MENKLDKSGYIIPIWLIMLHVVLGFLASLYPIIAKLWYHGALLYFFVNVNITRNKGNEAAIGAAYIVGMEVLARMCDGLILYESSKYFSSLLLIWGLMIEKEHNHNNRSWIYIILFLSVPAMVQSLEFAESLRKTILFGFSGTIALLAAAYYFYQRSISFDILKKILCFYFLPMLSLGFVLFFRAPQLDTINFSSSANFAMSGGFGPNQVATVLGMGYLVIVFYLIYKQTITRFIGLDIAMLAFLLYRSLFTFSRGGNFAVVLSIVAFILMHFVYQNRAKIINIKAIIAILLFGLVAYGAYEVIDNQTGGMFYNRISGKNTAGIQKEDITSKRVDIASLELRLFNENPLGVGIGGSRYYRTKYYNVKDNSHNEFGRLLSEHGIFGLIIILIMFGVPLIHFISADIHTKGVLVLLLCISLSTMMHSAMRIALPGFFYGLSLISLTTFNTTKEDDSIYRE